MKVLVTGADGFAGRRLVEVLCGAGHEVTAAVRPGLVAPAGVAAVNLELRDAASVRRAVAGRYDAVAHLAAIASVVDAFSDPGLAWDVNAGGTARLLAELGARRQAGDADPVVLLVSTAEVYDAAVRRPLVETDPLKPRSPYSASKRGAELAAEETAARTGLKVVVARSFPHTGPGQDERFAAPAFARRLRTAKQSGARAVKVGNLEPVRDLLDVRDVARAYAALLGPGVASGVYNVASGVGVPMAALFEKLAAILGVDVVAEPDPALLRPSDLPYLVGDASKLRGATGWAPAIPLEQTLTDLVHAQAN